MSELLSGHASRDKADKLGRLLLHLTVPLSGKLDQLISLTLQKVVLPNTTNTNTPIHKYNKKLEMLLIHLTVPLSGKLNQLIPFHDLGDLL